MSPGLRICMKYVPHDALFQNLRAFLAKLLRNFVFV